MASARPTAFPEAEKSIKSDSFTRRLAGRGDAGTKAAGLSSQTDDKWQLFDSVSISPRCTYSLNFPDLDTSLQNHLHFPEHLSNLL